MFLQMCGLVGLLVGVCQSYLKMQGKSGEEVLPGMILKAVRHR
eukprot:COSAG01_NODE_38379_length_490_cov_1.163683_1_plen_42_part_01